MVSMDESPKLSKERAKLSLDKGSISSKMKKKRIKIECLSDFCP